MDEDKEEIEEITVLTEDDKEKLEMVKEIEDKPQKQAFIKPTLAGGLINSFRGFRNEMQHKTIVRVFSDRFEQTQIAIEETEISLTTKTHTFIINSIPLIDKKGNRIFYVRKGENETTDDIKLKLKKYLPQPLKTHNKVISDLYKVNTQYQKIHELHKTKSINKGFSLVIIILSMGFGAFIGAAVNEVIDEDGDNIDIKGDYVEQKEQYDNPNQNQKPNDDNVVIP